LHTKLLKNKCSHYRKDSTKLSPRIG